MVLILSCIPRTQMSERENQYPTERAAAAGGGGGVGGGENYQGAPEKIYLVRLSILG